MCTHSLLYIFLCVNENELASWVRSLQSLQTRLWKVLRREKSRDMFGAMQSNENKQVLDTITFECDYRKVEPIFWVCETTDGIIQENIVFGKCCE